MSALPFDTTPMTEDQYLAVERASDLKHEFHDGEVFVMTGASRAHNLIAANLITTLNNQLRDRPCEVYPADMRVKVQTSGLYAYPDISVVCGEAQFVDDAFDTLTNPVLIIEVLSPSTEAYDRGGKFQHYRRLISLQEYLLVAQDSPRIERFLREGNRWTFSDGEGLEATFDLPSIGCALALEEVYRKVTLGDTG